MKVKVFLGPLEPDRAGLSQLEQMLTTAENRCGLKSSTWSYDIEQHLLILDAPAPVVRELKEIPGVVDILPLESGDEKPTFGELLKTWENEELLPDDKDPPIVVD